jgi:p-hydroxybenzoate 3-monooxygenase
MRTQVGIVGGGPAGLLLSQLLHVNGIESVILERHDRAYVEARVRAGVLEHGTVDMLKQAGVGERCAAEGLVHEGIEIAVNGVRHHIDLKKLTGGKTVTVYGQTEVTRDLIKRIVGEGRAIVFEAQNVAPYDIDTARPRLTYVENDEPKNLACDFIAGCDGSHGVCRAAIPNGTMTVFERSYPFAWLGILVHAPPPAHELIYAKSDRGFALFSMRGAEISRSYLQCAPDEDLGTWSDDQIWHELRQRLGEQSADRLQEGEIIERSITPMRSLVAEPLRFGRLFLAGDAAHIVPPTGAKGLNLAASDVHYLCEALVSFYRDSDEGLLDAYSNTALNRVWKSQRFSWWMTSMLHNFPGDRMFENEVERAELDYVLSSTAARTSLAENYVGLPFDDVLP